jgi:acetate kinase
MKFIMQAILVINAGSSSIKFSVYAADARSPLAKTAHGQIEGIGGAHARLKLHSPAQERQIEHELQGIGDHRAAMAVVQSTVAGLSEESGIAAVGHRVLHGGVRYARPVRIDKQVLGDLEQLVPLAPLHQPHNLAAIRAVEQAYPQLPQVACFDTAFHRGHPPVADLFGLPYAMYEEGVRRYGFHGLSYEYIAGVLHDIAPDIAGGRVVVAHLGNGVSLCALKNGMSMDSTMGLTALDGVPMGTRTGALDPGVLLYLMETRGMSSEQLTTLLYQDSGLLGVSGLSNDMRDLLASAEPRARLAVDYFVYRIVKEVGALASVLGGLDGLVFTAGIGENSAEIRARVCRSLEWLGVELDAAANAGGESRISSPRSRISAWRIPTDEELMIARHTREVLSQVSAIV